MTKRDVNPEPEPEDLDVEQADADEVKGGAGTATFYLRNSNTPGAPSTGGFDQKTEQARQTSYINDV